MKQLIIRGKYIFIILFSISFFWIVNPYRENWDTIFRPATLELLSFRNPYSINGFYNPPWGLIPLIPFAVLPPRVGYVLFATASMLGLGYVANKMGASKYVLIAFLLLPFTLYNGLNVNLDWLVAIGFILPPQIGLFFVLIKPQLGIGIAFFWFIQAMRAGGIKQIVKIFIPVTVTMIGSFLVFGLYFLQVEGLIGRDGRTLWHLVIPVAVVLLSESFRKNDPGLAITASPFLAPYVQWHSLPIALLGLMSNPHLIIPALLGMWLLSIDPIIYYLSILK